MKFTEFNLDPRIMKGIEDAGFEECLIVQEMTFPHTFEGKDVQVQSQTGTGKTAAFLISIFHLLLNDPPGQRRRALIIAPTRELAEQIGEEALLLGKHTGITSGTFYGGVGYNRQEQLLRERVDIIIGTPGRLIDFAESGKLDMMEIGILIIDEADRLFDMGFLPDIKRMLRKMPPRNRRQSMLFSATLDYRVRNIANEYMNEPVEIDIEPERVTVENISQKIYHVGTDEKINLLLGIMKTENPQNAIIFTNTKQKAVELSKRLEHNGFHCQYIIGDLPQKKRLSVIENVKSGKVPFLIATDVASRGLHIDDLEMVINYDLPENPENYVHRIGRTARVGKTGTAISLVCEKFVYGLEAVEEYTNTKIPVETIHEGLFVEDMARGMRFATRERERDGRRDSRRGDRQRDRSEQKRRRDGKPVNRKQPAGHAAHAGTKTAEQRKSPQAQAQPRPQDRNPSSRRGKKKRDGQKPLEAGQTAAKMPAKASIEDRLDYYRQKYGDEFIVVTEPLDMKKGAGGKTLISKIKDVFKRKKKK